MRNVAGKNVKKIKTYFICNNNFSPKIEPFMR